MTAPGRELPAVMADPPATLDDARRGIRAGLVRAGLEPTAPCVDLLAAHVAHETGRYAAMHGNAVGMMKATDEWIAGGGDYVYLGGRATPFPVGETLSHGEWAAVPKAPRTDGGDGPDSWVVGQAKNGVVVHAAPSSPLARFRGFETPEQGFEAWAHTMATGRYSAAVRGAAMTGDVGSYVAGLVALGPYFRAADEAAVVRYRDGVAAYFREFRAGWDDPARWLGLAQGMTGPAVEALQRFLNRDIKPGNALDVDGDFGGLTRAALMGWQMRHGLADTGVVDAATVAAIGGGDQPAPEPAQPPETAAEEGGDQPGHRVLVYLVFADPRMNERYRNAAAEACDVELVNVTSRTPGSDANRQLVRDAGGTLDGWLRRYPPKRREYDAIVFATFSAGYGVVSELLKHRPSAERIDGVVLIDSYHAGLDADGTARDADLAPLLAYALRAAEPGGPTLWLGHTDVPTHGYASTTGVAEELRRLAALPPWEATGADERAAPWRTCEREGVRLASYNLAGPPRQGLTWTGARTEHSAALTTWGHLLLRDALRQLAPRRDLYIPAPEGDSLYADTNPLGVRALRIAREQQIAGVKEIRGPKHHPRILEYFAGCERNGRNIGAALQADEYAWCAASASWCAFQAADDHEAVPHRWRAAVRELWSDAIASHSAVSAAALRRGDYLPQPGDLWIQVRGGNRVGPDGYPFAFTAGRGHVGRVVEWSADGSCVTLDGNINDTWTDVRRHVSDPELVGVIRYPRPLVAPYVPGAEELEQARRLIELSDAVMGGRFGLDDAMGRFLDA